MSLLKSRASIDVDLGEGYGNWVAGPDNELISLISYANVAWYGFLPCRALLQSQF